MVAFQTVPRRTTTQRSPKGFARSCGRKRSDRHGAEPARSLGQLLAPLLALDDDAQRIQAHRRWAARDFNTQRLSKVRPNVRCSAELGGVAGLARQTLVQ
jgi:hypothetical protein